jgi:hypothetical protein
LLFVGTVGLAHSSTVREDTVGDFRGLRHIQPA